MNLRFLVCVSFVLVGLSLSAQTATKGVLDKRLIATKVALMNGDTLSGYLMELDSSGIRLFDPDLSTVVKLGADQIGAYRIRRQGSFWSGWLKGFAAGESVLLMLVLGSIDSDDYFGPGFYIILGTMILVTPLATLTGILEGSTGVNIQHDLTHYRNSLDLARPRTQRFLLHDPDNLVRTQQGKSRLEKLRFDTGWKKRMHSIHYVPIVSFNILGAGWRGYGFQGQVLRKYSDWQPKRGEIPEQDNQYWRFGVSVTLSPRWEIGAEKHSSQSGWVSLQHAANSDIYASKEYIHYLTKVWVLYRLKPYYRGAGSKWQHACGLGWSGLQYDHYGYLSSSTRYNNYQISGLANGATLLFRSSYFMTNMMSVEFQGELAGHEAIYLPYIDVQHPEKYVLPAEEISVFSAKLSVGVRLHL